MLVEKPRPFKCKGKDQVCVGIGFTMLIYEVSCKCITSKNFLYVEYIRAFIFYSLIVDSSYIIPDTEGNLFSFDVVLSTYSW